MGLQVKNISKFIFFIRIKYIFKLLFLYSKLSDLFKIKFLTEL